MKTRVSFWPKAAVRLRCGDDMGQTKLRNRLLGRNFDSVHLQYLLAIAATESGEANLIEMINIYLQASREFLELATQFAHNSNKAMFLQALRQLGEGSERLGARRLTRMTQDLIYTREPFGLLGALDAITNEFVRVEIDLKELLYELESKTIV